MADLTEKEKRLIELEENTKRKALTEFESSKNLIELADATKEVLSDEFRSRGEQKSIERGRPKSGDAQRDVAERIGVSNTAITEARQHVAAVEKFPALRDVPKKGCPSCGQNLPLCYWRRAPNTTPWIIGGHRRKLDFTAWR